MSVTITVRGEHEQRVTPEQAIVYLAVRAEQAADRETALELVAQHSHPVRESLIALKDDASLTDWSSNRLQATPVRAWHKGRQRPPTFTASLDFSATFRDPAALARWLGEVATWDGVTIGTVQWQLTEETSVRLERECASAAVGVAVQRANAYAEALGLTDLRPVEIADTGLITSGAGEPHLMAESGLRAGMAAELSFEPTPVRISATVEARFVADQPTAGA